LKFAFLKPAKKQFVRDVATVATGTAVAQILVIAFAPFITRLYGPEAFGLFGMFMALVVVLAPVSALSYPIAIVLPGRDEEAKALIKLSVYISLGVALLVTLVLLAGGDWLLNLLGAGTLAPFKFLIPFNILFAAWMQISQQWVIRKRKFKISAKAAIGQAVLENGAKTGIGIFHPLSGVLIVASSIGYIIHITMLYFGLKKSERPTYKQDPAGEIISLRSIAGKYRDFPVYRTPQVFINAISQSLPVLILATLFGPVAAGFYTLGNKVLKMPSALIGNSVQTVFYPTIAEAANKGQNIRKPIISATLYMAVVGIWPFAVVSVFGPWIFGVIFGAEWIQAGEYARWISLWAFFAFLNRPSVAAIPVIGLQRFFLGYEIVSVFLRIVALIAGFYLFRDDVIAILLFSVTGAALNLFLIGSTICKSKSCH
jgi:O-antigen/teichoic acid export membrane protein